ncbi:MAG: sulfatase-like hydrolase/transferase [Bryobacterales bacterium]|nr:sulfatase-like hydrolase/transferase [Bryobacterales bacterium]
MATLTRRGFLGAVGGAMAAAAQATTRTGKPNVVIIYTDDQGTLDAGCYGSDDIHTPNIDALAARGVRFTRAYAHTVCCPSRSQLLTGRVPQRSGVIDWLSNHPMDENARNMSVDEVTLAEVLRENGYRTGLTGKWHLGAKPGHQPLDQGFDEAYGHLGGFIDNYEHEFMHSKPQRPPFHDLYRNGEEVYETGRYFPDLVVREATRFIVENKDHPFFLYCAFNVPHYPEQSDPKFAKMYDSMAMPRRSYASMITTTDDRIGQVLRALDLWGLRDNTLVLFMSDNGHSTEEFTNWDVNYGAHGGGGNTGKWRGAKASMFEGGVRVPSILSLPGVIPEGETRDQAISNMDFFPTILELCGVDPPGYEIDGKSLGPVLESADTPSQHHEFHWMWQGQWAVLVDDWKLIGNGRDTTGLQSKHAPRKQMGALYLANLSDEHPESTDHATDRPEVVARLQKAHEDWLRRVVP